MVDFRTFFSNRGILLNYDLPGQPAGANAFGVSYQRVDLDDAAGWTNVPASFSPAKQEQLKITNTAFPATDNVDRFYDLYIYDSTNDSTTNYNSVLVVPSTAGKNGTRRHAARAGRLAGVQGHADRRARRADRGLLPEGDRDRAGPVAVPHLLHVDRARQRDVQRARAGGLGSVRGDARLAVPDLDRGRLRAARGRDRRRGHVRRAGPEVEGRARSRYLHHIFDTLDVEPDLLLLGNPSTDEFQHQFMALYTPTDMDGRPNPYFDDVTNDNIPDGRMAIREGYIKAAYAEADETLGLGRELMGRRHDRLRLVRPRLRAAVVRGQRRQDPRRRRDHRRGEHQQLPHAGCARAGEGLLGRRHRADPHQPRRPRPGWRRRLPADYETVRNQIIAAFQNLTDPANPGKQVVLRIIKKEELRNVDGTDSLHPSRAATSPSSSGRRTSSTRRRPASGSRSRSSSASTATCPNLVDLAHNVNMHATFVASGPGIRKQDPVAGIRAIDVAPTLAFLWAFPGRRTPSGKILTNLVPRPGQLKQVTILDITDYHGQLVPLTEAADNLTGAGSANPVFTIGGSAFLKPWFDVYRAEATGGSITVAAGDSVGATPPISAFFGDTPTIELMNLMGFTADGLGNHNFDKGQRVPAEHAHPAGRTSRTSRRTSSTRTARRRPSGRRRRCSTSTAQARHRSASRTRMRRRSSSPDSFDPFQVANATRPRCRPRSTKLKAKKDGHDRRDGPRRRDGRHADATRPARSSTSPTTSPNVDAVIGDHTDFQVLTTRPNGMLVVENRSKGVRFTRVRLIVDTSTKAVVYKTADFHKPWTIGVTPDPAIQARIDELNAAAAADPRHGDRERDEGRSRAPTSAVGSDGRLCESLVGNVVTDAMRMKYAPIGAEFAITNSGGLRADLTCPTTDNPTDFCPAFTPPPYPITRGQVLGGAAVREHRRHADGQRRRAEDDAGERRLPMPAANGRFPQVSGLCFTYDIAAAGGVARDRRRPGDAAGNCTATPIDLTAGSSYEIAENDFMASGGDGYPNFASRMTTQDIMDQVLADHVAANSPLSPSVKAFPDGRINCADSNGATAPNCPTLVASP